MINKTEEDITKSWNKDYESPLVTIRCLAFNQRNYIRKALDSFLMQITSFPFEILVHDDCSTDGTDEIIKEYERRYPSIIRAIYESENQYSRHDGSLLKAVDPSIRGVYLAICEGDDYWIDPKKLQTQIDYMEMHKDYSMVFCSAVYVNDNRYVYSDKKTTYDRDYSTDDIIRGGGEFCASPSLCIRKTAYDNPYAFQKHAYVGDYPLQIAMSLKGKVHYHHKNMVAYREPEGNNGSITSQSFANSNKLISQITNEISWLSELDELTGGKYHNSILYRQMICRSDLLDLGVLSKSEIREERRHLSVVDSLRIKKLTLERKARKTMKNRMPKLRSGIRKVRNIFLQRD